MFAFPRSTAARRAGRPRTARGVLVAGAAVLAVATSVVPQTAHAATPGPVTTPAPTSGAQAEVDRREAEVDAAKAALTEAARLAADALERYTTAVRAMQAAEEAERAAKARLDAAHAALVAHRRDVGRWAREAYQGGSDGLTGAAVDTLLRARSTDEVGATITYLRRVGHAKSRTLTAVAAAEREQQEASRQAEEAAATAQSAAVAAIRAREEADAAVAEQRLLLTRSESALAKAEDAAAAEAARLRALAAAQALRDNRVTGAVGSCTGGAVESYANGRIPLGALCPLTAAPGHYLRADAAHAFDRLSAAYAAVFGTPICVTDSYRTYEQQVRLRAEKPSLAAVPGTSNHGWGTATDLCGGVQNFGSAQHEWLVVNAPLYQWFHPAWARRSGSKPEPWHWEFAG